MKSLCSTVWAARLAYLPTFETTFTWWKWILCLILSCFAWFHYNYYKTGLLSLVEPGRVGRDRDELEVVIDTPYTQLPAWLIKQNYFATFNWNSRRALFRVLSVWMNYQGKVWKSSKSWKIVSCAGIPGTKVLLRDIPGKNGIVGSYGLALSLSHLLSLGSAVSDWRVVLVLSLLHCRSSGRGATCDRTHTCHSRTKLRLDSTRH